MLPLLVAVAVLLLQVARLGAQSVVVASAAREGARAAAVTLEDEEVRRAALSVGLEEARTEVGIRRGGGAGRPVTVRVAYRAALAVPLLSWALPREVTLEGSVTMRQEAG